MIYATDTISEVSKFITLSLQDAKSSISTILSEFKDEPSKKADVIAEHKSKFDSIKHIFHITRLLQDYARIVGPDVDEGNTFSDPCLKLCCINIRLLYSYLC